MNASIAATDRRKCVRYPLSIGAEIEVTSDGQRIDCTLTDISLSGFRATLGEQAQSPSKGAEVELCFGQAPGKLRARLIRVRSSRPVVAGEFDVPSTQGTQETERPPLDPYNCRKVLRAVLQNLLDQPGPIFLRSENTALVDEMVGGARAKASEARWKTVEIHGEPSLRSTALVTGTARGVGLKRQDKTSDIDTTRDKQKIKFDMDLLVAEALEELLEHMNKGNVPECRATEPALVVFRDLDETPYDANIERAVLGLVRGVGPWRILMTGGKVPHYLQGWLQEERILDDSGHAQYLKRSVQREMKSDLEPRVLGSLLTADDVLDWQKLCRRLKEGADSAESASSRIWKQLGDDGRKAVDLLCEEGQGEEQCHKGCLLGVLNGTLTGHGLYEKTAFADVPISREQQRLLDRSDPPDRELQRVNRYLLDTSFVGLIAKCQNLEHLELGSCIPGYRSRVARIADLFDDEKYQECLEQITLLLWQFWRPEERTRGQEQREAADDPAGTDQEVRTAIVKIAAHVGAKLETYSLFREAQQCYQVAQQLHPGSGTEERLRFGVELGLAKCKYVFGDLDGAKMDYERIEREALGREPEDYAVASAARFFRAKIHFYMDSLEDARGLLDTTEDKLNSKISDGRQREKNRAYCELWQGRIRAREKRFCEAERHFENAKRGFVEADQRRGEADLHCEIANCYYELNNYLGGRENFEKALAIDEDIGYGSFIGHELNRTIAEIQLEGPSSARETSLLSALSDRRATKMNEAAARLWLGKMYSSRARDKLRDRKAGRESVLRDLAASLEGLHEAFELYTQMNERSRYVAMCRLGLIRSLLDIDQAEGQAETAVKARSQEKTASASDSRIRELKSKVGTVDEHIGELGALLPGLSGNGVLHSELCLLKARHEWGKWKQPEYQDDMGLKALLARVARFLDESERALSVLQRDICRAYVNDTNSIHAEASEMLKSGYYNISDESLARMRGEAVPDTFLKKLRKLEGRPFVRSAAVEEEVRRARLGKEQKDVVRTHGYVAPLPCYGTSNGEGLPSCGACLNRLAERSKDGRYFAAGPLERACRRLYSRAGIGMSLRHEMLTQFLHICSELWDTKRHKGILDTLMPKIEERSNELKEACRWFERHRVLRPRGEWPWEPKARDPKELSTDPRIVSGTTSYDDIQILEIVGTLGMQLPSPEQETRVLRILDAGCGKGRILPTLIRRFESESFNIDYVGIDVEPAAIDEAMRLLETCLAQYDPTARSRFRGSLHVGNLCDLRNRLGVLPRFDTVLLCNVFHELAPGLLPEVIIQLCKLTRPGGLIIVHDMDEGFISESRFVPWRSEEVCRIFEAAFKGTECTVHPHRVMWRSAHFYTVVVRTGSMPNQWEEDARSILMQEVKKLLRAKITDIEESVRDLESLLRTASVSKSSTRKVGEELTPDSKLAELAQAVHRAQSSEAVIEVEDSKRKVTEQDLLLYDRFRILFWCKDFLQDMA